jgi:hypothetical protein
MSGTLYLADETSYRRGETPGRRYGEEFSFVAGRWEGDGQAFRATHLGENYISSFSIANLRIANHGS